MILKIERQERFAQGLAAGKPALEAYVLAGYTSNRSNANTLRRKKHVSARVAELLTRRHTIEENAVQRAIKRTGITKAWVMDRLRENAERAMRIRPVFDSEGKATGEYRYDGAVANRALELIGRELGMFVNRGELKVQHDYAGMTDEQRMRWAYGVLQQARAVLDAPDDGDGPVIEGEPQGA